MVSEFHDELENFQQFNLSIVCARTCKCITDSIVKENIIKDPLSRIGFNYEAPVIGSSAICHR